MAETTESGGSGDAAANGTNGSGGDGTTTSSNGPGFTLVAGVVALLAAALVAARRD